MNAETRYRAAFVNPPSKNDADVKMAFGKASTRCVCELAGPSEHRKTGSDGRSLLRWGTSCARYGQQLSPHQRPALRTLGISRSAAWHLPCNVPKVRFPLVAFLIVPTAGCVFPSSPATDEQPAPLQASTGTGGTVATTTTPEQEATTPTPEPTASGGTTSSSSEPEPDEETVTACGSSSAQLVSSAAQLKSALAAAQPGAVISLAPGQYVGDFVASTSGTASQPITVCGTADSILSADDTQQNSLDVLGDHWVLSGFTVRGGLRGVVMDGANFCTLTGLTVHETGQEAIHLRSASSDNVVEKCRIYDTGRSVSDFGEGIYLGSAKSNWEKFTGSSSTPDRSNRNQVLNNVIGPDVRAEHIDVKEGTEGGVIRGNEFDGNGIVGDSYADSWVDIKGNDYLIEDNSGVSSPQDGFQVHVVDDAYGHDNLFRNNVARVDGPGYGFWVSGDSQGTIISCSNEVSGAGEGFSNQSCAVD